MIANKPYRPRPRRVPLSIPISASTAGTFLDSKIMNVSKGGVFIRSDIALPLGSQIDFEFTLPDSDRVIRAVGIVVWARGGGTVDKFGLPEHVPGMGVQFKEIAIEDLEFLLGELERIAKKS